MNQCIHGKELWSRCTDCETSMTDETRGDGMTLSKGESMSAWDAIQTLRSGAPFPPGVSVEMLADVLYEAAFRHCSCAACQITHAADCAVHNEPAMPKGPCDCGAIAQTLGEPVGVPDAMGAPEGSDWYGLREDGAPKDYGDGYADGWNACREAIIGGKG